MDGPQLGTDELELGRCAVVCPPLPEFVGTKRSPCWTFAVKLSIEVAGRNVGLLPSS